VKNVTINEVALQGIFAGQTTDHAGV